ncbi:hypothetical protein O7627_03445 [Solwaraspora sp. WMMD1047]|uniref:hypothetical protein n=1 Tax=Solwaraspora sp. WMMD1047 TaxID=3016102 RepID=UPI0024177123|nr:hypothetical protein [Solwaraspora sp. WMMD1047]MDG4828359.1 hypothetical protein [Solwaraspora sp. WMMD1047]
MSFISKSSMRRRRMYGGEPAGGSGRWKVVGIVAAAAVIVGGGLGVAAATTSESGSSASAGTVSCPTVADKLPAAPAAAQAEVTRNLAQLNTQIAEANNRIANSVGQGGPNFVQNAILGPLADKRAATIDRIRIAFNRQGVVVSGLDGLDTCSLASGGGAAAPAEPTDVPPAAGGNGNGGNADGGNADGGAAAVGTISCPSVADKLPAAPAAAQAEVTRNLALLDTQIGEANNRLVSTVGQGGPNFVQNAILGPLKSKRDATIDRIRIAFNRQGVVVSGLDGLGTCAVSSAS